MANHKKARPPQVRAHCSMCKPWKDGRITHESEGFESHSAHVERMALKDDVDEHLAGPAGGCGSLACCGEPCCPTGCSGGDE